MNEIKNCRDLYNRFPDEWIAPGNAGCPGCGAVLAIRLAMKVLGKNTWAVMTTGCMAVNYTSPNTGVARSPWIHPLFGNAAAIASGLAVALERKGLEDKINLLVVGGDGGTADIGFQTISAAMKRDHKFIYLCYNNSGYQNTGNQSSGTTDIGAITKTTPTGNILTEPKDLPRIFNAHQIPYIATANIAYPADYLNKVLRASQTDGPSYIEVLTPCVPGWGIDSGKTIKIAKLAVQTGYQILYEIINGRYQLSKPSKRYLSTSTRKPLVDFLRGQKRFRQVLVNKQQLEIINNQVRQQWDFLVQQLDKNSGDDQ